MVEHSILNTTPNKPVDKSSLGKQKIKLENINVSSERCEEAYLVINSVPNLPDCSCVVKLANCPYKSFSTHSDGNLRIDPDLEACGGPVNKSYRLIILNLCDGTVDIIRHHITSIDKAACHVQPLAVFCRAQLATGKVTY